MYIVMDEKGSAFMFDAKKAVTLASYTVHGGVEHLIYHTKHGRIVDVLTADGKVKCLTIISAAEFLSRITLCGQGILTACGKDVVAKLETEVPIQEA